MLNAKTLKLGDLKTQKNDYIFTLNEDKTLQSTGVYLVLRILFVLNCSGLVHYIFAGRGVLLTIQICSLVLNVVSIIQNFSRLNFRPQGQLQFFAADAINILIQLMLLVYAYYFLKTSSSEEYPYALIFNGIFNVLSAAFFAVFLEFSLLMYLFMQVILYLCLFLLSLPLKHKSISF